MQYLTRPDGSLPSNIDPAALQAAGIRLVRSTVPPSPDAGMEVVEGPPEPRDGFWWQTWQQRPAQASAPPPVPADVALWQFRAALKLNGWFARVEQALGQLTAPDAVVAAEMFEYGNQILRHSALADALISVLDVTEQEVDDLFRAAVKIAP